MHRIQKFILAQLMEQPSLRYSQMRPASMEASQFIYHLKKLQTAGLLEKTPDGAYTLSPKGRQFIDRADADIIVARDQPRVAALMICQNKQGETLYIRRGTQPFVGWVGFPVVDVPIDYEFPLDAYIATAFNKQTGLTGSAVHRADGYIKLLRNGELEGNLMAHVYTVNVEDENITADDLHEYFWAMSPPAENVLPSVNYVIEQLEQQKDFFFFEFEHTISVAT